MDPAIGYGLLAVGGVLLLLLVLRIVETQRRLDACGGSRAHAHKNPMNC